MSPLWQENFDFYEAAAEKGRAIVSLDLAAANHAPLASHPVRLQFRVKMQRPREDGLRSADEADALFSLEDRLVDVMRRNFEGLYVARAVAYGATEFFFYLPDTQREAGTRAAALLGGLEPYQLEFLAEDDPEWERYADLYPDAWSFQTILNRRLVSQMEQSGDQLEVPREVDHAATFPSRMQAAAASEALVAAGFRVDALKKPELPEQPWFLEFHREQRCDGEGPDDFVFEVLELIAPHEGDYDGWGAPVQGARAPSP